MSEATPDLDPQIDPKLAWALAHREFFPVDVNRAAREVLLRVPGLGRQTVDKLLQARRHRALRQADLPRLRVAKRAAPFLLTVDDTRSAVRLLDGEALRKQLTPPVQLGLFEARVSAARGEV